MEHELSLLAADEAAAILHVKVGTIYDWASRGVLPHVRILAGKRRAVIRFRRSDLERFIQDRVSGGGPAAK